MAELVPIKSFASRKGSQPARTGADQPSTSVARFAAIDYARHLTIAPDGSRITSTQKNVLLNLALYFNSDTGTAWPGMEALCKDACISDRHCRRNLESLERKMVIRRVAMRHKSGQTSNDYFFPSLGSPSQTPEAKARRLQIQKVSRTPMTRKAGKGGQTRPSKVDVSVRPARTNATGAPGHGCPPIESLGDFLIDSRCDSSSEAPAARTPRTYVQSKESRNTLSNKAKAAITDLGLARMAWISAREKLSAAEIKKYRLRDLTVVSASEDRAGTVHLALRSPTTDRAELCIAQHEAVISQALRAFYGCTVKLQIIGHAPSNVEHGDIWG